MKHPTSGGRGKRAAGTKAKAQAQPAGRAKVGGRPKVSGRTKPAARAKAPTRLAPGSDRAGGGILLVPAKDLRWTCPPIEPSGKPPTAAFLLGQDR
ncbi:MAG: hypothetical protein ACK5UQ_17350, partial [Planctomycetota bacterium]